MSTIPSPQVDPEGAQLWLRDKIHYFAHYEAIKQAEAYAANAAPAADATNEDALAPASWDEYIGQEQLKAHLKVRIAAALARDDAAPHILLYGPPGAGKTTIARLVASTLGRNLKELVAPVDAAGLCDALWRLGPGGVLFVDEVHRWSRGAQQHALMQLTEDGHIDTPKGRQEFDRVTVIAATTEKQKLELPLQDRFMVKPKFEEYSVDEMAAIISGMAARAGLDPSYVDDSFTHILGYASAGVPRNARALVLAARDLALAGINPDGPTVLNFAGVEPDGLTADHIDYLRLLADQPKGLAGGPTMATLLNVAHPQVRQTERLLTDRKYVMLTSAGRQITQAGRARVLA